MKAAIVLRPGELAVRDLPMPVPGPYQMLCRIRYGASCTATDQHILDQTIPFPVPLPTILGHESVAEVVEVGKKVRHFKVGDRIARVGAPAYPALGIHSGWGGFAEYGLAGDALAMQRDGLPESEWKNARVNRLIPEDIDLKSAPMMITWRETLSYITRMGMRPGRRVLIIGTGGNGLSFIRHAANMGA
ncbi:MAG TPA: alcohol dehydrogenase catalytic domain-containing protein, partial [Candidatus Faecaligallichristensenella faecipullorum]|nr:alcohol dehydrogenase catalytic domain-containing protein [Candidatus Faecaligallichristensenella faecipullorum]